MNHNTLPYRFFTVASAGLLLAITGCGGEGDDAAYPNEDITFIVPYDPGGSGDILAREWAGLMEDELGVNVTIQNNGGGAGTIGTSEILDAEPDGYTIGYGHNSPLAVQIHVNDDLPYSGPEDYTPIALIGAQPVSLSVSSDSPWETFEDFVAAAEENPGEHTIAVGAAGNVKDLQMRSVQEAAEVEFNITPFSGGGAEAVTAVMGGQVDSVAVNPPSVAGFVESDDLRPLAVFTDGNFDGFNVEVYDEDDYPGMSILQDVSGIIGPAGLPEERVTVLQEAHEAVMQDQAMQEMLAEDGYVVSGVTAEDFKQRMESDTEAFRDALDN